MSVALKRIAFAGIGNMGWPMAANLVKAGFEVTVCDVVPGRATSFATETGAKAAATPAEAASGADCVVMIVPTSKQVGEAVEAMLPSLKPGMLVIDMTSGQPGRTREIAAMLEGHGVPMIDCPVSGGVPRAKSGQLAIMVGGPAAEIDRAEPVLKAMGTSIYRCGDIGAGQAMKALNNLVSAGGYLIGIEALLIGQRFGLDLMVKDLSIALEVGRETTTPAPFSALCREMWLAAATSLGPGVDHTAVAKMLEQMTGTVLGGNQES